MHTTGSAGGFDVITVFAPKYRRQVIYGKIKADVGRILRQLCNMKQVELHEAEACADHIPYTCEYTPKFECISIY